MFRSLLFESRSANPGSGFLISFKYPDIRLRSRDHCSELDQVIQTFSISSKWEGGGVRSMDRCADSRYMKIKHLQAEQQGLMELMVLSHSDITAVNGVISSQVLLL